jgi:hypothetical protein
VDSRRANPNLLPQRRASRGVSTRAAEPLSQPAGRLRASREYDQLLALPDLGPLRLADTVYLTREGPRTIGLLFARDRLARSCLLALSLERSNGDLAWQATVTGVTRDGERWPDGVGASFLFYSDLPRETPK